jgi:ADP-ribose pyrophosphatase
MARSVYDGRIIRVEVAHVHLPNGVAIDLDMVRHPGAAAVVASGPDGVVLIRQYRFASGGYLWEIPAGTLHPGEPPEDCARRELEEEAGLAAEEIQPLGSILTTPGFCDERIHLFVARGLHPLATRHDADEVIAEVRSVPWIGVGPMIDRGEIVDAKSLVALYHAARRLGMPLASPGAGIP